MNEVLLIGNGFNLLEANNSWEDLLHDLTVDLENISSIDKPFPLLYEEILMTKLRKNTEGKNINEIEKEILTTVVNSLKGMKKNETLKQFTNLTYTILTTNYDYLIEESISDEKFINSSLIKETTYCLYRVNKVNNEKEVWHLHGEQNIKNSICLGYERYGANIQKIRNFIHHGDTLNEKKENELVIEPLIKRMQDTNFISRSWIDHFFVSNISIIGLGLDFHEIDLWWLLDYRVREKARRKKTINNVIRYYCTDVEYTKDRIDVLKALDVNVIKVDTEKLENVKVNYQKYYESVLKHLQGTFQK